VREIEEDARLLNAAGLGVVCFVVFWAVIVVLCA